MREPPMITMQCERQLGLSKQHIGDDYNSLLHGAYGPFAHRKRASALSAVTAVTDWLLSITRHLNGRPSTRFAVAGRTRGVADYFVLLLSINVDQAERCKRVGCSCLFGNSYRQRCQLIRLSKQGGFSRPPGTTITSISHI